MLPPIVQRVQDTINTKVHFLFRMKRNRSPEEQNGYPAAVSLWRRWHCDGNNIRGACGCIMRGKNGAVVKDGMTLATMIINGIIINFHVQIACAVWSVDSFFFASLTKLTLLIYSLCWKFVPNSHRNDILEDSMFVIEKYKMKTEKLEKR